MVPPEPGRMVTPWYAGSSLLDRQVDPAAGLGELGRFLFQAEADGLLVAHAVFGGVGPHVGGDPHGAELRPAHGAEVGRLGAGGGQRLVVVRAGPFGVEREVELVLPPELEAGLGERVVPGLGAGVALGQVGGVGGDLVGDHAVLHGVTVRQAEVLLGRDVTEHGGAVHPDDGGADRRRDVVVGGGD